MNTPPSRQGSFGEPERLTKRLELPPRLQNAYEAAKAKADLEYATRAERFPNHPQFTDDALHVPLLIQNVFFAFCLQARNACREGAWTVAQASHAIDAAWPFICDSYFLRERGVCSEDWKLRFRNGLWKTVTDEPLWKQHLKDLAGLAEFFAKHLGEIHLPSFSSDSKERMSRALTDASAQVTGSSASAEDERAAILYYLDSIAWECLTYSGSLADVEGELLEVALKFEDPFVAHAGAIRDRVKSWLTEARVRAENGVTGEFIPVRVNQAQVQRFEELHLKFASLPSSDGDLSLMLLDGGRVEFRPEPRDPATFDRLHREFERLCREVMVTLGFRFSDSSRAVYYWAALIKQENPRLRTWRLPDLCRESAALCGELKTRALEAPPAR